ncbi:hypothetical protein GCM10009799_10620 [Nocardiopsis rhodophaea]|uniref:Uncharacterized protein n=1 Tax=Nocardiopsis rhodophaea TaxID=280238 RepID=A0ABN2SHN6_9ACTN
MRSQGDLIVGMLVVYQRVQKSVNELLRWGHTTFTIAVSGTDTLPQPPPQPPTPTNGSISPDGSFRTARRTPEAGPVDHADPTPSGPVRGAQRG